MKGPVLLIAGAAVFLTTAWACGPFFSVAVFTLRKHPDLPRSAFLDGKLGVLQPTYARSYLVVAYRQMMGIGLNAREKEQVRDYYKDKATGWWDRNEINWAERYRLERNRTPGLAPLAVKPVTSGQMAFDPTTNSFALNCADDAYRTALHTLEARKRKFGLRSRAVREWVTAQDQVFKNCDGDAATIPSIAASDLPSLIQADREYQIAAAHLYAGSYTEARDRFARIGQNPASPWRTISRYLVVRTLFRMTDEKEPKPAGADAQMQKEANAILADRKLTPIHGMTVALLHRAGVYDGDPVYLHQLATLLSSRGQDNGLREELWDFITVYDACIGDSDSVPLPNYTGKGNIKTFRQDDLTLWIYLFQGQDASGPRLAIDRWKQTQSMPWLVAALANASLAEARREGLLDAARAVSPDSPAYLSIAYHYYRLLLEGGENAAARSGLDSLLASHTGEKSLQNLFRGLRMQAAPDLPDFLRLTTRIPFMIDNNMNSGEAPLWPGARETFSSKAPRLDRDSTYIFNRRLPLRIFRRAALDNEFPPHLRREILLSAFTRAVMLQEDASDLTPKLSEIAPELNQYLARYDRESTGEARRFAAALLLLHHPEARPYLGSGITRESPNGQIDSYRDNWWCPMDTKSPPDSLRNREGISDEAHPTAEFLSDADAVEAEREYTELVDQGDATDFLGSVVLKYAAEHRDDPRVPEALHLVVRASRYGCHGQSRENTARDAFRFLHRNYPRSPWTKRTPIWQ